MHDLNPALVILSVTGFGHDGPEAGRLGYDQILQGEGGLMRLTVAEPHAPTRVGVPIADLLAGMNGAFGVMTALVDRARTGRGRVVRTSLLAAMVGAHTFQGTRWTIAKEVAGTTGNHHPSISPYGLFRTRSSPIQVACGSEALWQKFARCIGLDPADPRYADNGLRVVNRDALTACIEERLVAHPVEHWADVLATAGIPAGRVRTMDEVHTWEQVLSQGLLISVEHSVHGLLQMPGPTIRFDDNTYAGSRVKHTAPPTLGQHNDEVRAWLDLSP